jgi:hypothetical protein
VIRIPFTPALTMFSIAVICVAASPSIFPAAVKSWTPRALACFCAPCFILTKNGFVSVFVISPTLIAAAGRAGADGRAPLEPARSARPRTVAPLRLSSKRDTRILSPFVGGNPRDVVHLWYR